MARRRKRNYRKHARTSPVRGSLVLSVVIVAGLALGWLWLSNACDALSARIKDLEQEKLAVHQRVVNEEFKWSNQIGYENMTKLLKRHQLEMDWPRERQIVRIQRAPADRVENTGYVRN